MIARARVVLCVAAQELDVRPVAGQCEYHSGQFDDGQFEEDERFLGE